MRLPIGLIMLAMSSSALAAGQGELETIFHSALQMVLVLLGLAAALVAARWLYDWNQCRKATRAAARAVKERVARGQKPYC
ncbi:hypothetical protein ACF8FF_07400 [Pseudomonas sp. zjy_13]|uniref:hypothetical protein n=1 Tax=Pseudomonas sp. zjy_13 TaxID=3367263 RepID=UPI00370A4D56